MSTNPEEYHAGAEDESPETGTTYNPATGEPETTPHDVALAQEEAEAGNPNAASSAGLAGDMGISSERTGPADETGTAGLGGLDRFDTRTVGTAKGRTHGSAPTSMPSASASPEVHGPEMDDTQQQAAQEWRDGQPAAGDAPEGRAGEPQPDDVPSHKLSNKNPGHSGGTPGQSSD
jgi:hypothetical protein